jgi:RNA polymerase sigma-70 factor (ECF subfamily)
MENGPSADANSTQRLSHEIDAAYEAYAAQQPDAETRLYRALRAQARNIVWHRLGSPDEVVEHDITTRAMQALKEFRGESRASTWFYTVAQNEANSALRMHIQRRERLVPIDPDEADDLEPKIALPAPPENLDAPLDLEELTRGLPPKQAEVLKLIQEGYSLEAIAEATGDPLGTVRGRCRLAKQKAKKKGTPK